ncbi:MAG: SRPBCC domain-containing protein [Gemmatimonadota bacterium]|nr:SRPBCC domain-containing protein [Gemmatimonadota bacterium]
MTERTSLPPVEKSIFVPWDPETAFDRFVHRIGEWWPLETHSVGTDRARTCAIEPREGGRVYETWDDGTERRWGTVTEWAPPERLAFTWHPGRSETTRQQVVVTFDAEGDGTRLDVVHGGWERLGEEAEETRRGYSPGWDHVLGRYADA